MKTRFVILLFLTTNIFAQPPIDGWNLFARVKFTEKFMKELNEYYLVPFLDSKIKSHEGKEITLKGYFLPFELDDKNRIIISKNPYSQCFFCGGAGPESVSEIVFASKRPRFKADQIITVTGTLKLNPTDINHMNFILVNARMETTK